MSFVTVTSNKVCRGRSVSFHVLLQSKRLFPHVIISGYDEHTPSFHTCTNQALNMQNPLGRTNHCSPVTCTSPRTNQLSRVSLIGPVADWRAQSIWDPKLTVILVTSFLCFSFALQPSIVCLQCNIILWNYFNCLNRLTQLYDHKYLIDYCGYPVT